jgi:hypothetical protein
MKRRRTSPAAARRARRAAPRAAATRTASEPARPRADRERARAARDRDRSARGGRLAAERGARRLPLFELQRDSIDRKKVAAGGERSRYDIDVHQFRFESGISDRIGFSLDLTHEAMSGATPWYITPGPDNEPLQVMTGATVDEERTDALLAGDLYFENGKATARRGVSLENDYLAFNGSLGGERSFNEKNTTVLGGIGMSYDRITPTDTNKFPTRPDEEHKQTYDVYLGLGQVLGGATLVQSLAQVSVRHRLPLRPVQARIRRGRARAGRTARRAPPALVAHALPPPLPGRRRDAAPSTTSSTPTTGRWSRTRSTCRGTRRCSTGC